MIERLPHVGELVLLISAPTPEGVYREALRGLAEEIAQAPTDPPERIPVDLDAGAADTLLADLLNDALYVVETRGLVPVGLEVRELDGGRLSGWLLAGRPAEPPRHLVKAATYHDLAMWHDELWYGRVVLDV